LLKLCKLVRTRRTLNLDQPLRYAAVVGY